jgi:4-amino-4-deoxy-L-arabinose transferase-like glycosyltransferase
MSSSIKKYLTQYKLRITLGIIILLGTILRFYNLAWGDGYFFHPDERNIGSAVAALDFTKGEFNPKFWAYGSLPIYIVYLAAWIITNISQENFLNFEKYLLIGRFFSAFCSVAIIPLTYLLTSKLLTTKKSRTIVALLAALWVTFLPGMIQFAHFTTFETFLTLEYLVFLLLIFDLASFGDRKTYLLAGIVLGLSIGTKITSLVLLPVALIAHFIYVYNSSKHGRNWTQTIISGNLIGLTAATFLFAFLSSPYHLLDFNGFKNSLNYESGVANGSLPVFYTQQFQGTIPGIYQITRVFPYILSLPLTILAAIALIHLTLVGLLRVINTIKKHSWLKPRETYLYLLLLMVYGYLGFHFTLYVKWTRYMVPVLPFLIILSASYLTMSFNLFQKIIKNERIGKLLIFGISTWVILTGVQFWQIYAYPDTRTEAAEWSAKNIPTSSKISTEPFDLGIMPFNRYFPTQKITLLPIYDLDTNLSIKHDTVRIWEMSDYFISTSQRIYPTRFRLSDIYPNGYMIYNQMLYEHDSWRVHARFSRVNLDCNLSNFYCYNGIFPPDETFSVFDHPTVIIFRHEK